MDIKRHDTRSEREQNFRHPDSSSLKDQIVQGVTEVLATTTYTPENLLRHVSIKINQIGPILKKNKTLFGRLINKFNGESPKYIVIDGMVLKQLFEVIGRELPAEIEAKNQYDIDHNDLRELYWQAKKIISPDTDKRKRLEF